MYDEPGKQQGGLPLENVKRMKMPAKHETVCTSYCAPALKVQPL
jgi:hypothetical protein